MQIEYLTLTVSGCRNLPRELPKAHLWYVTNTSAVYRCSGDYSLNSGNLVRTCINGSWTGIEPLCTAEGILPKSYMVLLIVGGIVFLFLICIPVDFYRYRKRKKVCRERRERMEMMTRIEPLHANLDRNVPVVTNEVEQGQAKFSFRSILSFFRLVKNTRKRHDQRRAELDDDQSREESTPATLDVIQSTHSNGLANLSEVDECADNGAVVGSDNTEMVVPSAILVSSSNDTNRLTSSWPKPQKVNFSPTSTTDTSFSPTGMPFIESPSHSSPHKTLLIENNTSDRNVPYSPQESPLNDCVLAEGPTHSLQGKKYERINLISESPLITVLKSKRFRQAQLSPLGESSSGSNRLPDLPTNVD